MADSDDSTNVPLPESPRLFVYDRRIVMAYASSYVGGLAMPMDELDATIDGARDAAVRCLDEEDGARRRAVLAGFEHAQTARTQGEDAVPRTFVV